MSQIIYKADVSSRIKTFRLYFYIALTQFLLFYIVPLIIFPAKVSLDVDIVSALSLGILVGLFFIIVNILGCYLDKSRRILYISFIILIAIYFIWVIISWAFIEKMTYLLR